MKDDRKYLSHILECIGRIEEDVSAGRAAIIQDAVIRNLQVTAESTQRQSVDLKAAHPEIDWSGIAGLRNALVHDYFGVDLGVVWEIVIKDVPQLKSAVLKLLE